MLIQIANNQQSAVEITRSSPAEILRHIDTLVQNSGMIFSHLEVDGVAVVDDIDRYLTEKLDQIARIEIFVKTSLEVVTEVLESAFQYLGRALPSLEELAAAFYQGPDTSTWTNFELFLEGMDWLLRITEYLRQPVLVSDYQRYREFYQGLQAKLPELEKALEKSDYILIADLLSYEIIPALQDFRKTVGTTLGSGVKHHDLN